MIRIRYQRDPIDRRYPLIALPYAFGDIEVGLALRYK